MSLLTHYLEYGSHLARLHRRRRRAYAPTNNTASHDNHEKINSWVSFCFPYEYGAPLGGPSGRRSSATKAASVLRHARLWKTYEQWNYFILTYHLHELEIVRRWPKQQRWYNYSCRSTTTIREKRKENFSRILVQSRIFTYRSTICLFHKSTIRLSFVNHSNSSYIGREFNKIIVDIYVDTVLFRFVHNAEKIGIEYFWRCHEMDSFVNTGWLKSYIRTCWNEINMITTPYTITNTNLL